MVQLVLRLTAAAGAGHRLVQALHSHLRRAAHCAGCSSAHLAADVDVADVYWYVEEWDNQRALEAKVRTAQFSELLALMETSAEAPLLEFRIVAESKGLEYVASLRGGAPGHPRPDTRTSPGPGERR
jgi:quinol monooxygenase YgiN